MMTLEELEKKMAELDELQAETENAHAKLKAQMAELEELQAETENAHAKLIAQIAELKAQSEEKPMPPHPRPKLNCCKMCYHIDSTGTVLCGLWDNTTWDYQRLAIGNVFLTEEAADFAAERVKVLAEMREWSGNWNDEYTLRYDEKTGIEPYIHVFPCKSYGEMRFATKLDAEGCIKAVGEDRLKKYYFGIFQDDGCCTSER